MLIYKALMKTKKSLTGHYWVNSLLLSVIARRAQPDEAIFYYESYFII